MRLSLLLCFSLSNVDILVEKCQKVYFPIDGYSKADFITVHAVLVFIIRASSESDFLQLGISPSEARETIKLCQRNVRTALEQSSLFLEPCIDNILALVHGVSPSLERVFPLPLDHTDCICRHR